MKEQKPKGIILFAIFFIAYGSIMFMPVMVLFLATLFYPAESIAQKFNSVWTPDIVSLTIIWGLIYPAIHISIGLGLLRLKMWALKLLFLVIPILLGYTLYSMFKLKSIINNLPYVVLYVVIILYFIQFSIRERVR
jgi:uncharacterized membrane protein (DUF2068 family)